MRKCLFIICYLLVSFNCVCQSNLVHTGIVKYMNANDCIICDTSIIYLIENNKFKGTQNVRECGLVYNNLKEYIWECFDKDGNLICHRYYDRGKIEYEIRYSEGKVTSYVDYMFIPESPLSSIEERRFRKLKEREYPLVISKVVTFGKDGTLKTKCSYDYSKKEYIETIYSD